jgi:proline racemase
MGAQMAGIFRRVIQTVDSHTEGNSTRVITGGYPIPPGQTLLDKRTWLLRHDDGLRRMLNFEPRGHGMMCSVLLMPQGDERADFAVIIMEQDEYVPMCGHCIIGTAMTVVATGMVLASEPLTTATIETPAGLVRCEVELQGGRIGGVSFTNVESFLLHRDAKVAVDGLGELVVDIAYGGDFYAIVDADALGLRLAPDNDAALIAAAQRIIRAVSGQLEIAHPERPDINRCYQTLFTRPRPARAITSRPSSARQARSTVARAAPAPRHAWLRCTRETIFRCRSPYASRACSAPALSARRWRPSSGEG